MILNGLFAYISPELDAEHDPVCLALIIYFPYGKAVKATCQCHNGSIPAISEPYSELSLLYEPSYTYARVPIRAIHTQVKWDFASC